MNKLITIASAVALSFAAGSACKKSPDSGDKTPDENPPGIQTTGSGSPAKGDFRVIVVTHGQASDPFWSVVKNGVDQAAADTGIKVEYQAPNSFDMVAMGQLIDAAVASKPDGLAISIPDAKALGRAIKNAKSTGIPIVSLNSGSDVAEEFGVLAHIGQTEYEAGYGAGQRMVRAGVKKALCINQEVGNVSLDLRCNGFIEALKKAGGSGEVLGVDLADPTESSQRVSAALVSKTDVDGILALGPTGAAPALRALKKDKKLGQIKLATFDLSPQVLAAIRDGDMLFAVDQQQYMQGYLPIILLKLYLTNLNTPGDIVLRTGPGFVTKENAARVIELSKKGTR